MIDPERRDPQAQIADLLRQLQDSPQQWFPAAKALGALGSSVLPPLLQLDDTADAALRHKIVYALGDIDDVRARERLLTHLADPNRDVQYTAAWVIGNHPHDVLRDPLMQLLADEDAGIRSAAVHSLRNLGEDAIPTLLACLQHTTPHVRAAAIRALHGTDTPVVHAALTAMLDDGSTDVVTAAVRASARPGRDDLIPRVTAMLAAPDARVRQAAADALGDIGNRQVVDVLLPMLHGPDSGVVGSVVLALGKLRDARAVIPLLQLIIDDDTPSVHRMMLDDHAAAALCRINSPTAVAPLLRSTDERAWHWFGKKIIHTLEVGAVPDLVAALDDPETVVRERAALMLGELGAAAETPLLRQLTDSAASVRRSVATALGRLKADTALRPLLECLTHDPALDVRIAAAAALGAIGNPAARDPLAQLIDTAEEPLGWSAVLALAALHDPRAFAPLVAAAQATDERRRCDTLVGFGDLGDLRAVPILLAVLDEPRIDVRYYAIRSLAILGDRRAVDPLISTLADPDDVIRLAACDALGDLRASEALAPLRWVAEHDDGWTDPDPATKLSNAALAAIAKIQGAPIEPRS